MTMNRSVTKPIVPAIPDMPPLPRLRLVYPDGSYWSIPYNELLEFPGHHTELRLETLRITFLLQGQNLADETFLDALDRHGIHSIRMANLLKPPTLSAGEVCASSLQVLEKKKKKDAAEPTAQAKTLIKGCAHPH